MEREAQIIRVSITGIITNILLAGFKLIVGLLANSIAIVIDAVNNASDVLSSVITVIGTKIAGRPADKLHPFGHGRFEYMSAAIISAIILYAGVTALIEAVRKIITPSEPEYSNATLLIVAIAVIVKFILGRYVSKSGEKLSSEALKNSGQDALMDSAISASTLIAAVIFIFSGVNLEAWLGAGISIVIIKAGVDMFNETTSKILGERAESELSKAIRASICEIEGISGAYDLILTNYGPDRIMGSVHIEVPDTWTADKIDTVSREIMHKIAVKHKVLIAAVGIYSQNSSNDEVKEMRSRITRIVTSNEFILQLHGFYCDVQEKVIRFDIVIDFAAPDVEKVYQEITAQVKAAYPDYDVIVQADSDYSD